MKLWRMLVRGWWSPALVGGLELNEGVRWRDSVRVVCMELLEEFRILCLV